MPNRWVEHIRKFARENNMTYSCALSDPRVKEGYTKKGFFEKLEQATPDTEPKSKGLVIRPRPEPTPDATAEQMEALRALFLRPRGIGTAKLIQKGLMLLDERGLDKGVLKILELTKKQSTRLNDKGEEKKKKEREGAYIDVEAVENNMKQINDLLSSIVGEGVEFYHSGGVGQTQGFKMVFRGGVKMMRDNLVRIKNWLKTFPSVKSISEVYDSNFKEEAETTKASEAAVAKDQKTSEATEWLGRPLTDVDFKDVVRSLKKLQKKRDFRIKGINKILESEGDSTGLISRLYRLFKNSPEILDDFKKDLLAKIFVNKNLARLPPDLGVEIASYLNLPQKTMNEILARTSNDPSKAKPKAKPKVKVKGGAMETHTHPDGTVMTGKTHTKSSRVIVEGGGDNFFFPPRDRDRRYDMVDTDRVIPTRGGFRMTTSF